MLTVHSFLIILIYGTMWSFCVYCGVIALFCNLGILTETIKKILDSGIYFGLFADSLSAILTAVIEIVFRVI